MYCGVCWDWGHVAWWARLTCHLGILRLMTRGATRGRRAGLSRRSSRRRNINQPGPARLSAGFWSGGKSARWAMVWRVIPHQDSHFHDRLQLVPYRHALALLEHGTDVILEDGLWTRGERAEKFADAHLRGARIVLHVFDVPRNLLWVRLQERRATAPAGAYPMSEEELDSAWQIFQARPRLNWPTLTRCVSTRAPASTTSPPATRCPNSTRRAHAAVREDG